MRFFSIVAVLATLLAITRARPLIDARADEEVCNKVKCGSAMTAGILPCHLLAAKVAIGKFDPFSATSCVVFAIDMGINIPAPCKPCLPFLKKTAISLGAKACDGAKVAGNCFINSAPVKACKGVFCKLTGQQPAPLLPITQPRIPLAHLPFSHQANDVAVPTGAPPIPNRKPESPVRRPLSPVRQPASPVQRSASPVQRTASPVQRTAGPVRKPTIQVKKPGSPRLSRSKSARDLDNVLSNVQV